MAWRQTKVEDQREQLIIEYINKTASMKDLCEAYGVSRKTAYKWYQRYKEGGVDALVDRSRAPNNPHVRFSDEVITCALNLKLKHPSFGPKKIYAMLKRKYPGKDWPSPTRLYEIFKAHHLVCSRKLRRRVPRTHPLGEINGSNDIWCADFKGWFLTGDRSKIEPLTITDAFSRFVICCEHLDRKTGDHVWELYSRAFKEFGLPLRIRTDNGPPFASTGPGRLCRLAVNLIKVGITPEWITPGRPEENGRHERFHRSLKSAVANPPAETMEEQLLRMEVYVEEFNFERPHEALKQVPPGSIYEPSTRQWDGLLRSPEYDTSLITLRKVCPNGCIHWKRMGCYVGQLLAGEYVGLTEVDNGRYSVYYGPVMLGTIIEGKGFEKPELPRRRRR